MNIGVEISFLEEEFNRFARHSCQFDGWKYLN